jgi:Mitochondrial K+-H+ exchange-related
MRIIALPLTSSVRGPRHTEESSPLVYYHFQMAPRAENMRRGWLDWATGKAASLWAQFGKAPESSWKVGNHRVVSDHRPEVGFKAFINIVQNLYVWREVGGPR